MSGIRTTLFVILLSGLVGPLAHGQINSPRGFTPRHQNAATSILRRGSTRNAMRQHQYVAQTPASEVPAVMDPASTGELTPPAPPTTDATGGSAAPAPVADLSVPHYSQPDPIPALPSGTMGEVIGTPIGQGLASCDGIGCDGSGGCGCGSVAPGCGAPGCVTAGCGGGCYGYRWIDSFTANVGVVGFKSAINRGDSGSFGFQEGFNWGAPWQSTLLNMNAQIGFRATQSDFSGADFTDDSRSQFFVTGGFYKRQVHGWQGGFVFDYMHDDWYTTLDLAQIRGELSWAVPNGSSVGLLFATSVATDETTSQLNGQSVDEEWESHDYFTFFYRVKSNQHRLGQWRIYAGFTGDSDGLVGSDFKIPLAGTWSLEPTFTYLVPDEDTANGGTEEESWNVAFNLVWYPGRASGRVDYSRLPLFDAADNGSLLIRRQ